MRRSILSIALLAFLALVPIPAAAATDPYGGITELKIPGAPTGRWSVATLTQAVGEPVGSRQSAVGTKRSPTAS